MILVVEILRIPKVKEVIKPFRKTNYSYLKSCLPPCNLILIIYNLIIQQSSQIKRIVN